MAKALRLSEKLDSIFKTRADIDGADRATLGEELLRLIVPPTLAHHYIISQVVRFLKKIPWKQIQLDIHPTDVLVAAFILDLQ